MKHNFGSYRTAGRASAAILALVALTLALSSLGAAAAPSAPAQKGAAARPALTQYFQDIPTSNFFYSFTAQLYIDGVVSGYTCGTPPAGACVPPDNLPYYVPNNNVTRGLMSIYIANARSDPYSTQIYISTTAGIALDAETTSGGEAVYGACRVSSNDCYALEGHAPTGDYAGYMYGGKGVYAESDDASYPAVDAHAYSTSAIGGQFASDLYRAVNVVAPPAANGYVQLGVNGTDPTLFAARIFNGGLNVEGNLTVGGSKTGYVVDAMQNVSNETLETGDVVVVAATSGDAVIGQIPVPSIKLASSANDSAVVGIVDQPLYVPDATTRAAYQAQEQADNAAANAYQAAIAHGGKTNLSPTANITNRISDEQGLPHATSGNAVAPGGYCNVVTLGSYKAVKVDASFGAIHPGDLLTTSPHAGYAMVVKDKAAASGAVIGKALSGLDSGNGTVTVLVTLK